MHCFTVFISSPRVLLRRSPSDDGRELVGPGHLSDKIIAALVRYQGPKLHLVKEFEKHDVSVLESYYLIGECTTNELLAILLDHRIWSSKDTREQVETKCFQWFLQKARETKFGGESQPEIFQHEYRYERLVGGASRLLSSDAEFLKSKVDTLALNTVLLALDPRRLPSVRGPVTVALARYFDVAKDAGHELFKFLISDRISFLGYQTNSLANDLIVVLSISASVFPLLASTAASIFMTENFVPNLIDFVRKAEDGLVNSTALRLLGAACIDSTCRQAIGQHCTDWLQDVLRGEDHDLKAEAATVLAMVQTPLNGKVENGASSSDIYETLRDAIVASDESKHASSIEGLAYISLQPAMKEKVVHDKALLAKILKPPDEKSPSHQFGSLTLLENISRYLPNLTEEQKKVSELKAYANASKPASQPDPLDQDEAVARRCTILLAAGVVPYLAKASKSTTIQASPASLTHISTILLSLSRNPKNRGLMAQQGAIIILLQCFKLLSSASSTSQSHHTPAHTLARILISVDPKLAFGSRPPSSAIHPLLTLLQDPDTASDSPRDMLPLFESLLALTNLASDPSFATSAEIMRSSFPRIEELLLDNNSLIQRAATELICNLMTSPEGLERFADGSRDAARRLRVLVALADVDDVATRRGASGALAMITEFEGAIRSVAEQERGMRILLDLCGDEDAGCRHRAVVCVRNLVTGEGEVGERTRKKVIEEGGAEVLKKVLRESREQAVLETAVVALKVLLG